MPRSGIADLPLHYGKTPPWLFDKMKRLGRAILIAIVEEFGTEEFLRRLADPIWFQSLGCVLGYDWHSSGVSTVTIAALKEGLRGIEEDIGIYICGGKGRTSRKTPEQIEKWGEFLGFSERRIKRLVYTSKISAKVDTSCLQDGFQLYHHNLIFTKSGKWSVIQQGLNLDYKKARRYHWLSSNLRQSHSRLDFIEEPHFGIISDVKLEPLNLTAKKSRRNREISTELVVEEPKTFLRDIKLVTKKSAPSIRQEKISGFAKMELKDVKFHYHPVLNEKFDLKKLKRIVDESHFLQPKNFEELLTIKGVGPKTIRALSLVSELIYGAKASYKDPVRYSFTHGGKDGVPYFPRAQDIESTIEFLEKGIKKAKISNREKIEVQRRLNAQIK